MTSLLTQCLLGMECKDFVMIAADQMSTQGAFLMKDDVDKLFEISDKQVLAVNGETGEVAQFTQFVCKNLDLYKMRNKYRLDTPAVVHFTRTNLADELRNGNPYTLNMLVGGFDEELGGQLYTIDFLASCVRVAYAAHGLGGQLGYSIMGHYHKPNISLHEAYEVLKLCVREIQQRLILNLPNFRVKAISRHGIQTLPNIVRQ